MSIRVSRRSRPYVWTLGALWLLPCLFVLLGFLALPKDNPAGQCEGIGFGCALPPADLLVFIGFLAAPGFLLAGLLSVWVIALVQRRRQTGQQ